VNPEDIIVVNHWQTLPCNASTLPLVTLCNSIDFHESIAISYRASSQKRPVDLGQGRSVIIWICSCIFYGLPPAPSGMKLKPLRLGDWIENLEQVSQRQESIVAKGDK